MWVSTQHPRKQCHKIATIDATTMMTPTRNRKLEASQRYSPLLGNSTNSAMGCLLADDYGECDVSLQNYRADVGRQAASSSSLCLENMSSKDSTLLQQCLRKFGPSSSHLDVSETGKCSFVTAGGHKFELCIQGAGSTKNSVSMSVVIHKVKHTHAQTTSSSSRGSYSLMTKMMKYNTKMNRQTAGHIGTFGGTFIFFKNADVSVLTSEGRLESVLKDFMLKAVELSNEFRKTKDDIEMRKKHLKRRHRLVCCASTARRRTYP